jgi:hypothetical protein
LNPFEDILAIRWASLARNGAYAEYLWRQKNR